MKQAFGLRVIMMLACAVFLAGCRSESPRPQAGPGDAGVVDFDGLMAEAGKARRPVVVLVTESGHGSADDAARTSIDDPVVQGRRDRVTLVVLDMAISRNRATAARFNVADTPMLFYLSPRGLIVSRDGQPITRDLILKRIDQNMESASALDAKFVLLEDAIGKSTDPASARLDLADFLLVQGNAREAIGQLAPVAHGETIEVGLRVRAWVSLARAHLWIAEPEKSRHEAKDLIATLGPKSPEALAGGNLVLGLQDAKGKRFALARREFESAVAAAPDSAYAKQATDEIAKLPAEGK